MAATVSTSVQAHGGRTTRYGEYTIVHMHGCSFITTPMEYLQNSNWARGRQSCGNPSRDRSAFVDRFETVIGRSGSGVATRGNPSALARIVKSMKANSVLLEEWLVPRNLDQGMEMKKKPAPPAARAVPAAVAVAVPVAAAVLVAAAVPAAAAVPVAAAVLVAVALPVVAAVVLAAAVTPAVPAPAIEKAPPNVTPRPPD